MTDYVTKPVYITYKCSRCQRTVDVLQDNERVFNNACSITEHCQGKLAPIKSQMMRSVLAASENSSLLNQVSVAPTFKPVAEPITLNTAQNVITLALELTSNLPNSFYLKFNLNTAADLFQEYTYTRSNFNEILGADNSSLNKVLTFTTTDKVLVYLNGVQLSEYVDYTLEYSQLTGLGYGILFTNMVYAQSDVRVAVFTTPAAQYSNSILFTKHTQSSIMSAWSNVTQLTISGVSYALYSSDQLDLLPINQRLTLTNEGNPFNFTTMAQMRFLLANPNYTAIDRDLLEVVPASSLNSANLYLTNSVQGSDYVIQSTRDAAIATLPLSIDWATLLDTSAESPADLTATATAANINTSLPKSIIGVL